MEQKNVSSLELLNDTAKHIYGKHYIECSDYETSVVNMRISQVFREHNKEKITYSKWFEYLDAQPLLRLL
ncbi:MAG: hypothetical protein Q7R52_00230 [archaeon]|nr:hypothetical protein [archaeon]